MQVLILLNILLLWWHIWHTARGKYYLLYTEFCDFGTYLSDARSLVLNVGRNSSLDGWNAVLLLTLSQSAVGICPSIYVEQRYS